jgi:energy-coupling factor transporter ATP-binding protein EcfA2
MRDGHRAEQLAGGSTEASLDDLGLARVTAIIGPYGSGKSELALALALAAHTRKPGINKIALADLDVLKPYFRSREAKALVEARGVELLAPLGSLAGADLPIIPAEVRGYIGRADARVILDVGGDPVGARALGSLSDVVAAAGYDLLFVLNRNRPFAESFDSVMAMAHQIMGAANLGITGVVSNTHMMEETTLDDVIGGLDLSRRVATALGVDVRCVMVPDGMQERTALPADLPLVVTVRRHMKPEFLGGVVLKTTRLSPTRQPGSTD